MPKVEHIHAQRVHAESLKQHNDSGEVATSVDARFLSKSPLRETRCPYYMCQLLDWEEDEDEEAGATKSGGRDY